MQRLIILRHAKSDWNAGANSDHERPLNPRGRKAAPRVAERLVELGWVPQVVRSSDATRTQQTWARMQPIFDAQGDHANSTSIDVEFTRSLYLAGPSEIRSAIRSLADDFGTAMVIGHNPGWEDAVHELCGVQVQMTTCNAALLTLRAEGWSDAAARSDWNFESVIRPKEL